VGTKYGQDRGRIGESSEREKKRRRHPLASLADVLHLISPCIWTTSSMNFESNTSVVLSWTKSSSTFAYTIWSSGKTLPRGPLSGSAWSEAPPDPERYFIRSATVLLSVTKKMALALGRCRDRLLRLHGEKPSGLSIRAGEAGESAAAPSLCLGHARLISISLTLLRNAFFTASIYISIFLHHR
jgi:hypothetical protein